MRKTAKALAISDFMRNPHVMSERKAQNLMMEQHAFQRPLDQDSHLDLANQQKPGMARIDRPRKKVGLLGDDNKLITNVRR